MTTFEFLRALALIQLGCAAAVLAPIYLFKSSRSTPIGKRLWNVVQKGPTSRAFPASGPSSGWVAVGFALVFYYALPYWIWRWGWWRTLLAIAVTIGCGVALASFFPSGVEGASLTATAAAVGVARALLAYTVARWDGRWRLGVSRARGWVLITTVDAVGAAEAIAASERGDATRRATGFRLWPFQRRPKP